MYKLLAWCFDLIWLVPVFLLPYATDKIWRRLAPQNKTPQTIRVMGRSVEQPSPEVCSITNLPRVVRMGKVTLGTTYWLRLRLAALSVHTGHRTNPLQLSCPLLQAGNRFAKSSEGRAQEW
jgi:hypothetical protein